jgi:MoxR-like ATPase
VTALPADVTATDAAATMGAILDELERAVVGKRDVLELVLLGLVADGHVLLDDLPGVAKTLTARSLAQVTNLSFSRIQFTPDLLPADITGATVFEATTSEFRFRPGPIFGHLVLGDEVNRAPAKTQAALLEAMQERQVTVDGQTHRLPRPFLVVATQNPIEHEGTYALPEAQLDRFLLKVRIDYPSPADEMALVRHVTEGKVGDKLNVDQVMPLVKPSTVLSLQAVAASVRMDEAVLDYAVRLARATRSWPGVVAGAGPRGGISLMRAARAAALIEGRDYVTPDDVKRMALPALRHRIAPSPELELEGRDTDAILKGLLEKIEAPRK